MLKARPYISEENNSIAVGEIVGYHVYCPGCKHTHFYHTNPKFSHVIWDFNGDTENPTFNPSLMVNRGQKDQCHFFVRNGNIEYCGDCHHEYNGQKLELEDPTPHCYK